MRTTKTCSTTAPRRAEVYETALVHQQSEHASGGVRPTSALGCRLMPSPEEHDAPIELDLAVDPRSLANAFRSPVRSDPWRRWPKGEEPMRVLELVRLAADTSNSYMVRMAQVEIEPGVLPDPRPLDEQWENPDDPGEMHFLGRWNARWCGNRLAELSLDIFSEDVPKMLRIEFDPAHPVDLQAAYVASFPGLWGITICNYDTPVRNSAGDPLGHQVTCRDPRLAVQIAARYPGIAVHQPYLEIERARPSELVSEAGKDLYADKAAAAAAVRDEPVPGLRAAMDDNLLRAVCAMAVGDAEPPPVPFVEVAASTLYTYTLIGTLALELVADARLVRCDQALTGALSSHITFAHAIGEIRRTDPDRLPLWLDFTDADGQPLTRSHGSDLAQPLYGVLIAFEDAPERDGPFHVVIPIGRAIAADHEPVALCALAIGANDDWRYPLPDDKIGLITTHRGGVVVRNTEHRRDLDGVEPALLHEEIRREIAGHYARTTEWVLARIGAVLAGLREGVLHTRPVAGSDRTYDLLATPRQAPTRRSVRTLDAIAIANRLRELGSLRDVAESLDADIRLVHETLVAAGIDPDQVRRDEVLRRFRATGSVEAVAARYPVLRGDIERFLREAGMDPTDSPVPHDVTDPDVLEAISVYRQAGTLEAAGDQLGVRGETVRRRIARAGLSADDIDTDADRREREAAVDAWNSAGNSLAGAARALGIDPRTLRERLLSAGIPETALRSAGAGRADEIRQLHAQLGSAVAVAAMTGLSLSHVRRQLRPANAAGRRHGGPRVSDHELDQAELAFAEHGSIRAAARALAISPGGFAYRLKLARARHQTPPADPVTEVP